MTTPVDRNNFSDLHSTVGGYRIVKVLGKGAFGEVWLGDHIITKEKVALKFLSVRPSNSTKFTE